MPDQEPVLFIDADGTLATRAAEILEDRYGDAFDPRAAAVEPAGDVEAAADVSTDGVLHLVTIGSEAKANCPAVSPGTHYLHWQVDDADALPDHVDRGFGGAKTFTATGDLPAGWAEEE